MAFVAMGQQFLDRLGPHRPWVQRQGKPPLAVAQVRRIDIVRPRLGADHTISTQPLAQQGQQANTDNGLALVACRRGKQQALHHNSHRPQAIAL